MPRKCGKTQFTRNRRQRKRLGRKRESRIMKRSGR